MFRNHSRYEETPSHFISTKRLNLLQLIVKKRKKKAYFFLPSYPSTILWHESTID